MNPRIFLLLLGVIIIMVAAIVIAVRRHDGKDSIEWLNITLVVGIVIVLIALLLFFI